MKFLIVKQQLDDAVDLSDLSEFELEPPDPDDIDPSDYNSLADYVRDQRIGIRRVLEYIYAEKDVEDEEILDPFVTLYFGDRSAFPLYYEALTQAIEAAYLRRTFEFDEERNVYYNGANEEADEEETSHEEQQDGDPDEEEVPYFDEERTDGLAVQDMEDDDVDEGMGLPAPSTAGEAEEFPIPRPQGIPMPTTTGTYIERLTERRLQMIRQPVERGTIAPISIRTNFQDPRQPQAFIRTPERPLPSLEMHTFAFGGTPVTVFRNRVPPQDPE